MAKELFIGREGYLHRLRKDVFFVEPDSVGHCYSLIGLNGIGKTFLIRHLGEEFEANQPDNTFYFETIIEDGMTFWTYWTSLLQRFSETISEEYIASVVPKPTPDQKNAITRIKEVYQFVDSGMTDTSSDDFRSQLVSHLDVFKHYTKIGVRIIITIDEFDRAQTVFQTGQFFQRLFGLSPKGAATRLNLSIITISRRRVSTIAHHMQEGSNFEDAFPPLALMGFNDKELAAYFDTYRELPCGLLPEEAQKQILYLCGRSPGLLMSFRHEFEVMMEPHTDIGRIYAENGQFIKNAYERMITLMESSFADRAQQKSLLNVFTQTFVGPVYDDNFFETKLPLLYDYGFVTKGTRENNIFLRTGVWTKEETEHQSDGTVYEPIAPYFIEYIKYVVIPDDFSGLSGSLIKAERLIRSVIEKELKAAFPATWKDIVNGYALKKDSYLEALQETALKNDFSSSSITKLNVISFNDYFKIMRDHWNLFAKYFTHYSGQKELREAMGQLSDSRNDSAHLNLTVYNGDNRDKLRETCKKFIGCLEKAPEPLSDSSVPTEDQIEQLVLDAALVTFCCEQIKKPRGNLRGTIKEYGLPAGIAQKSLGAFGFTKEPKIGDEFKARIEKWDANAGMFNLKAPG